MRSLALLVFGILSVMTPEIFYGTSDPLELMMRLRLDQFMRLRAFILSGAFLIMGSFFV